MGVTLITACMNRNENLDMALATWIELEQLDQILIVDWSSEKEVKAVADKYEDKRIEVIRVNGRKKWVLSQAFNLAARMAKHDCILKVDADVKVFPEFFSYHKLDDGVFYTGNGLKARNDNERYLNGMIYIRRADFFEAGGYNEYIQSYGWDDDDLYARIENLGLRKMDINADTLYHIPHLNRHKFQPNPFPELKLTDREISLLKNYRNQYIVSQLHWTKDDSMQAFDIKKAAETYYVCDSSDDDLPSISRELMNEAERQAFIRKIKSFHGMHKIALNELDINELKKLLMNKLESLKDRQ